MLRPVSPLPPPAAAVKRLEYAGPPIRRPGDIQPFPDFVFPLIFLTFGLLVFGLITFIGNGARTAFTAVGLLLVVVVVQAIVGVIGGCYRGYFDREDSKQLWSVALKLGAAFAFGSIGWCVPFGYLLSIVLLPRLLMWLFDVDWIEAVGMTILCPVLHLAVVFLFSLAS